MDTRNKVLALLETSTPVSGAEIGRKLEVSRQAVNRILKELVMNGKVQKSGRTRGALYSLSEDGPKCTSIKRRYVLSGLQEDAVFEELTLLLPLKKEMTSKAWSILQYAFTEMLNNAIDHSRSAYCDVFMELGTYNVSFRIRDFGRGLFHSIQDSLSLDDEYTALIELTKGKRTSMPERHSGEGIFFTSKAADRMEFSSHQIRLVFDNEKNDVFASRIPYVKGTDVYLQLKLQSGKSLQEIFSEYAPEEYDFQFKRSRFYIRLFQEEYISRSEARRLYAGLDDFSEIILDFNGVKTIGQGFADEIFRVFKQKNPEIAIKTENANPVIQAMITHVDNGIK